MPKLLLSLAEAAARWLPAPMKSALYRLGPVSRGLRAALNSAVPSGLSEATIAGGRLAGARMLLDMQTEKDYWLGTYEMDLQQAIQDWAQPGMVAYDVGANIGYISVLLASSVGENGQVFAFEPLPSNQDRLQKNIILNPNAKVKLVPKAVADKAGKSIFLVHTSGGMGKLEGSLGREVDATQKIEVEAISLDDFVYKENNPAPQLIKIDIEGGEVLALKGMTHLLQEICPILLMELHGREAATATWDNLGKAEYSVQLMQKGYPQVTGPIKLKKKAYIVARRN